MRRAAMVVAILVVGTLIVVSVMGWQAVLTSGEVWPAQARARMASCQSNLGQIHTAFWMYVTDDDEHMPLDRSLQDLVGRGWHQDGHIAVREWGPVGQYVKAACIVCCPSDPYNRRSDRFPEPGISYRWNRSLAGMHASQVPTDALLLWERELFHRGGRRNVALAGDGSTHENMVMAMDEPEFQRRLHETRREAPGGGDMN